MPAMACKLSGLFSIGEDFDDEDLLETDWAVHSVSGPSDASAVSSSALRASSATCREPVENCLQQTGVRSAALCDGTASRSSTQTAAAGQALSLRQLSTSAQPRTPHLPESNLGSRHTPVNAERQQRPSVAQEDFDDWDVDLADLDECDRQTRQQFPTPHAPPHMASAKSLRPPACGGIQRLPECSSEQQTLGSSSHVQHPPTPSLNPCRTARSAPPQHPPAASSRAVTSPAPNHISRTLNRGQHVQNLWATPRTPHQPRGLFETVSPSPSPSSASSSALSPHPLNTPVLTNRLVQLVSASNKIPRKRPRSDPRQPRTRRFPGPAGLLPQQPQGQSLEDIVVSVPQTPSHGAAARSPSQVSGSQVDEDEFGGGAWATMKAEMGLDERNPSCFLHSFSVVMVLRKAALKQLTKNKVPNMALLLKSIIHTHTDARAVFKDPTGEIQGTVHRRLLEDRVGELKVGAVLLLKQVGVFSPSHRNHYLNVTPNNLLRIYSPDGVSLTSTPLPPLVLEPTSSSPVRPRADRPGPVSRMQLVFDDDDNDEGENCLDGGRSSDDACRRDPRQAAGAPQDWKDSGWEADDDLDELLGELPEDTYSW